MRRRQRVDGMMRSDERIIEYLQNGGEPDLIATPSVIAVNIDYKPDTVRKRLLPLRDAGLVGYYDEDRGMYELSDLGRRWINGELDDDEIDQIESVLDD